VKRKSFEASHYANFSLLGRSSLLSTLLTHTANLCSSLAIRDQVSHPHKTADRIIVF